MSDFGTQLAVGITLLAFAIGYWTFKPEIEKFTEKIRESEGNPKKHTGFLTENIYRPLMRVGVQETFDDSLIFVVPTDPRAFQNRKTNTYTMYLMDKICGKVEEPINSIEYTIPHLKKGIQHLGDKKYKELKQYWDSAIKLQEKYNNDVIDIQKEILKQVSIKLKNSYNDFVEFRGETTELCYFAENISKTLFIVLFDVHDKSKIPDFDIRFGMFGNLHTIRSDRGTLLQSSTQDNLDLDKLNKFLKGTYTELNLSEKFEQLYQNRSKIASDLQAFGELLEDQIIDNVDVEGGYIVKGVCDSCSTS